MEEIFRTFLQGRKTYITAIATFFAALVAFMNGQIDMLGLIEAVGLAAGMASLRAGIKTEVSSVLGD